MVVRSLLWMALACTTAGSACTVGGPPEEARCVDGRLVIGSSSEPVVVEDCSAEGRRCDESAGCVGCTAGTTRCDGASVSRCAEDGMTWRVESACSSTEVCHAGACVDACALAATERSYEGCIYDAVSTPNPMLDPAFDVDFGIVIGNSSDAPSDVRITRGAAEVSAFTVPARSAHQVTLPFVQEISRASAGGSTLVRGGAYRIESSRPIAAYQYNPLEFRRSPSCVVTGDPFVDAECFTFTNDASLLLPIAALGTEYLIEMPSTDLPPSFVTVVAHAPTHLSIVPTADIAESVDRRLAAHPTGERFELDLAPADVLTLVSTESLAGSEIVTDVPVFVVAGWGCARVPARYPACDHLEEVMLPVASWGTTALAAAPRSVGGEPTVVRVMSAADDNEIVISGLGTPIPLDRGESFEMVATRDLLVEGTDRILVSQYLVGAQFFDRGLDGSLGDPSMGIVPFVEQYRSSYGFAVPDTYTTNTAMIVTPDTSEVRLDGVAVVDWESVGGTPYHVARVPIASGSHVLDAPAGAGLTLFGLAPFTSYLLPGGLDVELLE